MPFYMSISTANVQVLTDLVDERHCLHLDGATISQFTFASRGQAVAFMEDFLADRLAASEGASEGAQDLIDLVMRRGARWKKG